MLKVTDAYEFVHRKITRNKVLMEIYKLYEDLLECEIILKSELQSFYKNQQNELRLMNDIELLQTTEYTLERENTINNIMPTIGIFKLSSSSIDIKHKIVDIKNMINEKINIMNNIQELIPIEGIATNYQLSLLKK
jgi:hypothetical protein